MKSNKHANNNQRTVELLAVRSALLGLRANMMAAASDKTATLKNVHENFTASAQNLLHYLALRRQDLRPLQQQLAKLGLSSLGRAEAHALSTVDSVLEVLHQLLEYHPVQLEKDVNYLSFAAGERLLANNAEVLLGTCPTVQGVRVMVTMPSEAANDYSLIENLLKGGMNCMRINCAHDNPAIWTQIIENLRRAEQKLNKYCKVVMDLGGPKLRTGPLKAGPEILKIKPRRDCTGKVIRPARVWLCHFENIIPVKEADACLTLSQEFVEQLLVGDNIYFTDARKAKRSFHVVEKTERGYWLELSKTAYLTPKTRLQKKRKTFKKPDLDSTLVETLVGSLPVIEDPIVLHAEDELIITRDLKPGHPMVCDAKGEIIKVAKIGCTLPEVFDDVRTGESIWFDDGKIGGVLERVDKESVRVRIKHCKLQGLKLLGDKGINLPESALMLSALTAKDLTDLTFVAEHADIVELSFANTVADVLQLHEQLARLTTRQPAVILKIETRRGFENLPSMLITAMGWPSCGVMIARGDLAVECGFERLAEIQEEILWVCEAAHVPVIWATQVLETLAKEGFPSRAEITDAAMGHRAECVMLNKGPHILEAMHLLVDIFCRMEGHQAKKRSMLRELRLAHLLPEEFFRSANQGS